MHTGRGVSILMATLLALLSLAPQVAWAQLTITKTERYYAVSGRDERALLADMRRHGPRVTGQPALASTRMEARYSARLRGVPGHCQVRDFRLRVRFVVLLPRLRRPNVVQASTRRRWPGFLARLRRHEARHIAIWTDCLKQVDRKLRRMSASTCSSLKRRMENSYRQIMRVCNRRHDAFDNREHHVSRKLPFIRAAMRQARAYNVRAARR